MSVSLFAYEPEKCDGEPCIGDCSLCPRCENESVNIVTDIDTYYCLTADLWDAIKYDETKGCYVIEEDEDD